MRKLRFILFILFLTGLSEVYCQEISFFFVPKVVGSTAEEKRKSDSFNEMFFTDIINELIKNFPCIAIRDDNSVKNGIAEMHLWSTPEFGSKDVTAKINAAANAKKNSDYYVSYSIYPVNEETAQVEIKVFDKKGNSISQVSMSCGSRDIFTNSTKGPAVEFINQLKRYEICPFTGAVSITISSDLDSTNVEEYGVYCNGSDQRYHKELEIKNHTFSDWKLERKGNPWTEGTMTFYINEETKVTEENGCYKCKNGQEGRRTNSETSSMKVKGSGISHESIRDGKPQDDTRIELQFLESGKYFVLAKGTSQAVTGEDKVVTQAEGTCDNQPQETKLLPKDIRVPLRVIFGPYDGKPTDKLLQQKDTKEVKDPVTNEKQTITIDFTLTQKDK